MKKIKGIVLVILALMASVCLFMACQLGEDAQPNKGSFVAENAQDFHISESVNADDLDLLGNVKFLLSEGQRVLPTVDASEVVFGTKGEYSLKYNYNDFSFLCKVFVYGQPTISFLEKTEFSYLEAMTELDGLAVAKDSFNNSTIAGIVMDDEQTIYHANGSVNFGTHNVKFATTDRVGNMAVVLKEIKVIKDEAKAPSSNTQVVAADVGNEKVEVGIDLKNQKIRLLTIGNNEITDYNVVDNKIVMPTDVLDSVDFGKSSMRVVTENGVVDWDFTLTDSLPAQVDSFGRNNFIFQKDVIARLPQVNKLRPRQNFELKYKVADPDGGETPSTENSFTPTKVGEYAISVEIWKNAVKDGEIILKAQVLDAASYNDFAFNGRSVQHQSKLLTNSKIKAEYVEVDLGDGMEGVYKVSSNTAGDIQPYIDYILQLYKPAFTADCVAMMEVFVPSSIGKNTVASHTTDGTDFGVAAKFYDGNKMLDMVMGKWIKSYTDIYSGTAAFWVSVKGGLDSYFYLRNIQYMDKVEPCDFRNSFGNKIIAGYVPNVEGKDGAYKIISNSVDEKPIGGGYEVFAKKSPSSTEKLFAYDIFIPTGTNNDIVETITSNGVSFGLSKKYTDGKILFEAPVGKWFTTYTAVYSTTDEMRIGIKKDATKGQYYYIANVRIVDSLPPKDPGMPAFVDSFANAIKYAYDPHTYGNVEGAYKIKSESEADKFVDAGRGGGYFIYKAEVDADNEYVAVDVFIPLGQSADIIALSTGDGYNFTGSFKYIDNKKVEEAPIGQWFTVYTPIYTGSYYLGIKPSAKIGEHYLIKDIRRVKNRPTA